MIKSISFLAAVAFALSASSVEAAKKKTPAAATSTTASAPKNLILQGKGSGGAAISQGCKMNGKC